MRKIQPLILAGGTGSRLWPLSRELYPKQLLNITGELSLLQTTWLRLRSLEDVLPPIVIVGEEHRFITLSQLKALDCFKEFSILLEPVGRNTAPAICGGAEYAKRHGEDTVLLVLPADHLVQNEEAFGLAVRNAAELAEQGAIVTFGITPTSPETGYGYIEKGEGSSVLSFKEKPDLNTAESYLKMGNYSWNSGMFVFTVKDFLAEMEVFAPTILSAMISAVENGAEDGPFYRFESQAMEACPSDSIDYVLMEKTDKAAVVDADLGWSDIGSWGALWEVESKDEQGNVTTGPGTVYLEDTRNCLIRSEKSLVAAVGLEDTLVVETSDAVLVAPLSKSQDVKKIVSRLKMDKRKEYILHATVYRPWGSYTVLDEQERFQIKRISVNPGAKLSLQMHHHRSEHWVVVSGTALVTRDSEETMLHENESTYISAGTVHRLENPGVIDLEIIEVQNGSYLGEDDIVRFDDVYGRKDC